MITLTFFIQVPAVIMTKRVTTEITQYYKGSSKMLFNGIFPLQAKPESKLYQASQDT